MGRQTQRAVRLAFEAAFKAQSQKSGSVLPLPKVKDDVRQQPKAGETLTRLAIMPENTDIQQEYLGNEYDENHHTIIIEWSVFVAAGVETISRIDLYDEGLKEIEDVLLADIGWGGTCAHSKPVKYEPVDEDYGGAGSLSAGFIFVTILLDSRSVLS